MPFKLFLFDLDDTLLDFRASEALSFKLALESLGVKHDLATIFKDYQAINTLLWKQFEQGLVTKDHLKVERFRHTFVKHDLGLDPLVASLRYLDTLPETVVLIEGAIELCERLRILGEIGIITNGIEYVQNRRIQNSKLAPYINFLSVSEECGFAKPDVRFFEYTVKKARSFNKESTVIVGDRLDADILGAQNFGIASCWFNPHGLSCDLEHGPSFEVRQLAQIPAVWHK